MSELPSLLHENDDGCLGSLCSNEDRLVACRELIIYFIMHEDAVYEALSDTVYDTVLQVVVYDDTAYDAVYDTVYDATMMQVIITYKYNDNTALVYNNSASAILYAVYNTTVVFYAVYNTTMYDSVRHDSVLIQHDILLYLYKS